MKFFILPFVLFTSFAWGAYDDQLHLYAEPDVGFSYGKYGVSGESVNIMGVNPGLNLGWRAEYVHVFLTSHYGVMQLDMDDADPVHQIEYGVGFGFEWNIPVMTSFILQGMTYKDDSSLNVLAYKFVTSFFLTQNIKVNLAVSSWHQQESETDLKANTYTASLSIPFDIAYPKEWWRERRISSEPAAESMSSDPASEPVDDSIETEEVK